MIKKKKIEFPRSITLGGFVEEITPRPKISCLGTFKECEHMGLGLSAAIDTELLPLFRAGFRIGIYFVWIRIHGLQYFRIRIRGLIFSKNQCHF